MTINKAITEMLKDVGINEIMTPIYLGDSPEFAVFAYDIVAGEFADDAEILPTYDVRINYVAPLAKNTLQTVKNIRNAIAETFGEYADVINASDEYGQDFRFEFEVGWEE